MDKIIEFVAFVSGSISLATIFGLYLARMITFESRPLGDALESSGRCEYAITYRINMTEQMNQETMCALFMNNFTDNQCLNINNQFTNLNLI